MVFTVNIGAHEEAGVDDHRLIFAFIKDFFDLLKAEAGKVEFAGKGPARHVFNKEFKEGIFFKKISVN